MKLIYRFFLFHNIFVFIILKSSVLLAQDHFQVEIENTGISQLFIFQESIIGLDIGDEIGIFDGNAITNHGDCTDSRYTLLVGAGVWTGERLAISAFGSINTCDYEGGYQSPGFVDSNAVIINIWDSSMGKEYSTPVTFAEGDGFFDEFSVAIISELQTYGGCKSSAALSCSIHAELFDDCITCLEIPCEGFYNPGASYDDGSCIYPTYGCTDSTALNYDSNVTNSDGSCDYPPLIGIKIKKINLENQTLEIWYNSPVTITSYQFSITGADILSIVGQDTLYETNGALMGQFEFLNSTGTFCLDAKAEDFTVLNYNIINLKASGCVSMITPELGGTLESEGVNVNIPAGALQQTEAIGIGGVTDGLPKSITNATGYQVSEIFAFTPYNLLFNKQVELTLPQSQLSRIRGETGLCILIDETDIIWDIYPVVCPDSFEDCTLKLWQTGIYTLCAKKEDCNGDMGGDAFTDDCSECVGGNTEYEENFTMDECDLCDGPGKLTWYYDQDEDGLGDSTILSIDCANYIPPKYVGNPHDPYPNCGINYYDNCGICGGDGTLCPENCENDDLLIFYRDVDGDTYGDSSSSGEYCSDPGDDWVENDDDKDDACYCSNIDSTCKDVCDICNGAGLRTYWRDLDGDGLGNPNFPSEQCPRVAPENYVPNSSDQEPECTTNDTDFCSMCGGNNECIPKLEIIFPPANEILPLKVSSINLQFTVPLLPNSNAVYLTSNYYDLILDLDVDFNLASDEMQISFDQLTSGDTITLLLFPFQIVANKTNAVGDYEYNMSKIVDTNISVSYPIGYLGDYNHDSRIDTADVEKLIEHWGGDTQFELGPCAGGPCKPIDVPHLTPHFDEKWDIEDLMAFILMYNYYAPRAQLAAAGSMENVGASPSLLFDKNSLKMVLPQYNLPVHHIWIQVDISGSEVSFHPAAFSSQFDIALNRDFSEENAGQWSLIELNGIDLPKEFTLGSFQGSSRDGQSMEIQYKLTSKGHVLSSGSMALEYTSIPNNYELSSAYPNPFNPVTTIEYALPENVELILSVYDIQGRLVTHLAQGLQPAGYHKAVWNGAQYASGMYFLRMNVYNLDNKLQFNKLQKLLLVK